MCSRSNTDGWSKVSAQGTTPKMGASCEGLKTKNSNMFYTISWFATGRYRKIRQVYFKSKTGTCAESVLRHIPYVYYPLFPLLTSRITARPYFSNKTKPLRTSRTAVPYPMSYAAAPSRCILLPYLACPVSPESWHRHTAGKHDQIRVFWWRELSRRNNTLNRMHSDK